VQVGDTLNHNNFMEVKNMEFVFIWFLFGIISSLIAYNKGRSGCGWFILGFLLGPFGLIWAIATPKIHHIVDKRATRGGGMKQCPYCAELVRAEAIKCPHCHEDLAEKWKCPNCNEVNPGTVFKCGNCGYSLNEPVTANELEMLSKSIELPCTSCINYDYNTGVCKEIHENVREYPKKFTSKCDGRYYERNENVRPSG
jgi:hypothetical protein